MRITLGTTPSLETALIRTFGPAARLGDQLTDAMPKQVRELLARPDAERAKVGSHSLGQAIADGLRFRFAGSGAVATREIVGENASAAALLAGEKGPAVRDALKGLLNTFGKRNQAMELTGLTMASNNDALLGNLLVSTVEQAFTAGEKVTVGHLDQIANELERGGFEDAYGVYDGAGWMHLNPSTTQEFQERIAAGPNAPIRKGELVATLQHELEHSVTPSSDADFARVPWLEESQAELLTQWEGSIAELATGMGIQQVSSGEVAYAPQVRELTKWITRTGLDPNKHEDLAAARDLLQSGSLGDEPKRIAEAIVSHEGAGDADSIAAEITKSFAESAFRSATAAPAEVGASASAGLDELQSLMSGWVGSGMTPAAMIVR